MLDAIRAYTGIGNLDGVIEADETFFRESFKQNYKKSKTFTMPRNAHKRGTKGSHSSDGEKRKRGISIQQVCVMCAMDGMGNIVAEPIYKGRMKHTDLERLFKDRVEEKSILCIGSHKSYIQFAKDMGIELNQIKRDKHKKGIYHIQHINAFHNNMSLPQ